MQTTFTIIIEGHLYCNPRVDEIHPLMLHYFITFLVVSYNYVATKLGKMTRSQVTGWNPLEGSTKSSCGKLKLGGTLPTSNSRKG